MKTAILFLSLLALLPCALADDAKSPLKRLPARCEVVMSPGMRITATTSVGTIAITAVDELTRAYTWDGATRAVEMQPHKARYYGSLGLYYWATGVHWRDHHGIQRCFTAEGQQHFETPEEAMKWIKQRDSMPYAYRDDGLMVGWYKDLSGVKLGVDVWQILIDGKKATRLSGSQNDKIVVETVGTETVPLVKAVARNDLKAVTALLAQGADPNVKNSVDVPVLLMAIRHGTPVMVEALLKNKANPNVRDVDTDLPALWQALTREAPDRVDILKMLLAADADVNGASRKEDDLLRGVTPLMAVIDDECKDVIQLFLNKGADVNTKASNGMTPLMLAALNGSEDLVQLFLDEGADVNAKTPTGLTALSWAKLVWSEGPDGAKDRRGVIRKLEAAGAKN
jgi:hypothetical protein